MRRLLVLLCVFMLSATPAQAQGDRVLFDVTTIVLPDSPINICIRLDGGTAALTTRLVKAEGATMPDGRPRVSEFPVDVGLYAYRGRSDAPGLSTTATLAEAVSITPVEAGVYCLYVVNRAAPPAGANPNFWGQWVAVKLTHAGP